MGIGRDLFYDTRRIAFLPMGFCFPGQDAAGGDLPPRRECAPAWRARALAAMPAVELVLAVGQYAQVWHLGREARSSLGEAVADWRDIFEKPGPRRMLPLPHPSWRNNAWLAQRPWFKRDLLPVLRREVRLRV